MCDGMLLNALYMILKLELLPECALYDSIKIRAGMCLNAFYMLLLKWDLVRVWMHSIYDIIWMGAGMCLYALYIVL